MRAIERGLDSLGLLSDSVRESLSRRLRELGGIALILLAVALTLALVTWSVQDPSLSHATNKPMRNMLGGPGAVVSDLLMQLFGIAAIAFVLPIAIWGWRLITHRALSREGLRLMFWIIGLMLAAACAASLPHGAGWPLPAGLGGVTGDALIRLPTWLAGGSLGGWTRFVLAIVSGTGMLTCFAVAVGFGLQGEAEGQETRGGGGPSSTATTTKSARGFRSAGSRTAFSASRRASCACWPDRHRCGPRRLAMPPDRHPAGSSRASRARRSPRWRRSSTRKPPTTRTRTKIEAAPPAPRKPKAAPRPSRKSGGYQLPPLELLAMPKAIGRAALSPEALQTNATALEGVLGDFGVRGEIINARPGPVVTLYELEPAPGIKSSRVIGLADDIARSMSALSARVAVVSGRNAIGIELPNPTREKVFFRELLATKDYDDSTAKLPLCLGKTIGGEPVIVDLARMPHLLIAGTTGSGKSVAINTMILSLLYRLKPEQCRLIMVDPKMLELSVYDGIPHLLTPVVTDPKKAVVALKWAVREMEERYKKMSKLGVRNIDGYNARARRSEGQGREAQPHRAHRLRQGDRARRSTRTRSSISSRCPTSSSSSTRWPT